jgi:hypothetical protein
MISLHECVENVYMPIIYKLNTILFLKPWLIRMDTLRKRGLLVRKRGKDYLILIVINHTTFLYKHQLVYCIQSNPMERTRKLFFLFNSLIIMIITVKYLT